MKRIALVVVPLIVATAIYAQQAPPAPQAQTPQQQAAAAAAAKQAAVEKATPKLQFKEEVLPLVVPGHTIGETVGVAKDSKGHLYVLSRSGGVGGPARGAAASELFEFDPNLKFVKQWGIGNYAASFAHSVRVDKYDNVWMVDEGSGMIVKYNPQGGVAMVLGRKPEAIDYLQEFLEFGEIIEEANRHPVGRPRTYNRPTDVTWDTQDNIFIADGYGNSRVAKVAKDGEWVKAVGTYGSGPDQFNLPHTITSDAKGNIYVGDRTNRRIQVYDPDLNLLRTISDIRAPWGACVSPGAHQYLFTGDSNGNIYKLELDGKLLGWSESGLHHGQNSCLVHMLHCESENVIYKGDCSTWIVEKITISAGK